jgi:hypothetical protein
MRQITRDHAGTLPRHPLGEETWMFESAEEKAAKKQAREAEETARRQTAADERRRRSWSMSAPGGAAEAKVAGDEFYECQLQVGSQEGQAFFGDARASRSIKSPARTLAEIERIGWRLEHANHVFMTTGQISTGRAMLSGENTAVTGAIVGVYLFRNDRAVEAPADAGPPPDYAPGA